MKTYYDLLVELGACREALHARKGYTLVRALEESQRGDWLLWLAARLRIDNRTLILAKATAANTVRHLMSDKRSIKALDDAFRYGRGELEDIPKVVVRDATVAVVAAAVAIVDTADATYATYAAADAAAIAAAYDAAAYATIAYATYAANTADAGAVTYAAARVQHLALIADLIRPIVRDAIIAAAIPQQLATTTSNNQQRTVKNGQTSCTRLTC